MKATIKIAIFAALLATTSATTYAMTDMAELAPRTTIAQDSPVNVEAQLASVPASGNTITLAPVMIYGKAPRAHTVHASYSDCRFAPRPLLQGIGVVQGFCQ